MNLLPYYSTSEIELLSNKNILLGKNQILKKITAELQLFGQKTEHQLRSSYIVDKAKVSKGENLEGYPFRVLDYPRIFSKRDVFAFRTLFWWGNFISFTLHLKGTYLVENLDQLKKLLIAYDFQLYVSSAGNEWEHNPSNANYQLLNSKILSHINSNNIDFLKIVQVEPLSKVNQLNELYQHYLKQLIVPLAHDRN